MTDTPSPKLPTGLVGPREVAGYLGVSHSTFMKWCARGPACPFLPQPFFRIGGQLRWRVEDVVAWVDGQRVAS
jgi:predicted DNA-binding transcriptional regulator AlpA